MSHSYVIGSKCRPNITTCELVIREGYGRTSGFVLGGRHQFRGIKFTFYITQYVIQEANGVS